MTGLRLAAGMGGRVTNISIWRKCNLNFDMQYYKGIPIQLINRKYGDRAAKRFTINGTSQNVWIPNNHLSDDGTTKAGENIDYVFRKAKRQLELAGIVQAISGIKRMTNKFN